MPKITGIDARTILDSRGEWTIEVALTTDTDTCAIASVPQGKSTGTHEAFSVSPQKAVVHARTIGKKLKGFNPARQKELDGVMCELDGTKNKKRLGANTILAISIAAARVSARIQGIPLWKYLHELSGAHTRASLPRLFVNVINGGLHAGNNLPFQEYIAIPRTASITRAIHDATLLFRALEEILAKEKGLTAKNKGDEGGFAPRFKNPLEPFTYLMRAAKNAGISHTIDVGLDAAATNIAWPEEKLATLYRKISAQFPLIYLEDPFGEEQFSAFASLRSLVGDKTLLAGDDLTVTNVARMQTARRMGSVNAVIIKPNQIGTVSEALEAVHDARTYGWAVVASHRSGETNDDFIADFATAVGANGLKLGAPARGERIAKYNRLLEIEKELH